MTLMRIRGKVACMQQGVGGQNSHDSLGLACLSAAKENGFEINVNSLDKTTRF